MNELYTSISEVGYGVYDTIIRHFFNDEDIHIHPRVSELGHLWIATHQGFDTLTWEPYYEDKGEGKKGQYEIAVRIHSRSEGMYYKYPGYEAREGYMVGKGTGGH